MALSGRNLSGFNVGLCGSVLLRVFHPLFVLLWMGSVEYRASEVGTLDPWYNAQCVGDFGDVYRQLLAHLHDESTSRCHA